MQAASERRQGRGRTLAVRALRMLLFLGALVLALEGAAEGDDVHSAHHRAAVSHAEHRKAVASLANGRPIHLPVISKSPPVCSAPPDMRFCKSVTYPVYRPSAEHTFAELDFDSHAVYKKIVPHMRISERHFELPIIEQCRANFREFLCLRNFPGCCHVGLCNKYGAPEPVLTTVRQDACTQSSKCVFTF